MLKKKDDLAEGDIIIVTIDGRPYKTVITNKVQRFIENTAIRYMCDHNAAGRFIDVMNPATMHTSQINLNTLAMASHEKKFTLRDYMEINMMLGYSVSGFCDLSQFHHLSFHNPLWDEGDEVEVEEAYDEAKALAQTDNPLKTFRNEMAKKIAMAADQIDYSADAFLEGYKMAVIVDAIDDYLREFQ